MGNGVRLPSEGYNNTISTVENIPLLPNRGKDYTYLRILQD